MLTYMRTWLTSKGWLRGKEEGASLVEYALLVALIALVCIAAVTTLGTKISDVFTSITTKLPSS